jgi:ubiquitin-activating enzyme E1
LTFEKLFQNQIRQLLYNFPEDQVTSTQFDIDAIDDFIAAAANLRAEMYGISDNRTTDEQYFRTHLTNMIVPDFIPVERM